jgi:2-phosphoglycolate phosphatase
MIKLVIFDLDGTLVNAYPAVCQSVNYTLRALGLPGRSCTEVKRNVGGGDRKLMAHFAGEELADRAIAVYRPHHARALRVRGAVKLLPGALGVLKFLEARGYRLAIASNRPTRFTRIILKALGAAEFFDVVLCADKISRPKPYPDLLRAIARRLNCKKSDCLYVGDMTIDIDCARRAGMRMVAVSTGSSTRKALKALKPWRIIGKMDQFRKIIERETL